MHLDLTLRDRTKARIEVPEGQSLEAALDAFLNRRGTYANGWVREARHAPGGNPQRVRVQVQEGQA